MSAYTAYRDAIFNHHNTHERWPALFDIQNEVEPADFWRLFRDILEGAVALHNHAEIIRRMLTAERVNSTARLAAFTDDDREFHKRMIRRSGDKAKPIKIYRGAGGPNRTGFMWTTKMTTALQFAFLSGFQKPEVVVAKVQPSKIILADSDKGYLFVMPEDTQPYEFRELGQVPDEKAMMELRMRIIVGTYGANHPLEMTPLEYFQDAIRREMMEQDVVIRSLSASRKAIEPLGFKTRVATIDTILQGLESDAVRSA